MDDFERCSSTACFLPSARKGCTCCVARFLGIKPIHRSAKMQFIYKDLGPRQIGEIVEVTLTNPSNVRLMDDLNFANYKKGVKHIYTGGVVRQSAVRLQIPTLGHWHLAVDTQGLQSSGSFGATVKIIEG
jgi:hypothetical protein